MILRIRHGRKNDHRVARLLATPVFVTASSYGTGSYSGVEDLNGHGLPELAVAGHYDNETWVSVFLAKGGGYLRGHDHDTGFDLNPIAVGTLTGTAYRVALRCSRQIPGSVSTAFSA